MSDSRNSRVRKRIQKEVIEWSSGLVRGNGRGGAASPGVCSSSQRTITRHERPTASGLQLTAYGQRSRSSIGSRASGVSASPEIPGQASHSFSSSQMCIIAHIPPLPETGPNFPILNPLSSLPAEYPPVPPGLFSS